jgi:hypothetical protein
VFSAGLFLVVLTFLFVRPLNSPWHPFIAGDGLGYYSYLPAKFIHNDPQLDFKWFNRVHNANYAYSTFDNPEDNLLVQYQNKRINKYYQGLSFIWMPFFIAGHVCAKLLHYPPDGFSRPYQIWMGIASVFYLLVGLILLRLLLLRIFRQQWIASSVPLLIFFGTHLFTYAIFANTLSHAYSFTFVTGFLYYSVCFFQEPNSKTKHFLIALLFLVISACIRPLTILILLALPAFVPAGFSVRKLVLERPRFIHILILFTLLAAVCWQLWLTHIQTGSFLAYTYTDEKFNFADARFWDALFSYHLGLFVYVPLIFLSLFGVFFMRWKMATPLILFFFAMIFLYSAWWYWPITKRAIIDFYVVPAIFLGALFSKMSRPSLKIGVIATSVLYVFYFQFKALQVRNGILDEFLTYKELFWRNFLRTEKANIFPVPPKSIIAEELHAQNFESTDTKLHLSSTQHFEGSSSLLLDSANYISSTSSFAYPKLFSESGVRKIRLNFELYAEPGLQQVHAFLKFLRRDSSELLVVPFYVNEDFIFANRWDHKEFGYELVDTKQLNADSVARIEVMFWNVYPKKKAYIDHVETDFILCNRYFETVK